MKFARVGGSAQVQLVRLAVSDPGLFRLVVVAHRSGYRLSPDVSSRFGDLDSHLVMCRTSGCTDPSHAKPGFAIAALDGDGSTPVQAAGDSFQPGSSRSDVQRARLNIEQNSIRVQPRHADGQYHRCALFSAFPHKSGQGYAPQRAVTNYQRNAVAA